MAKAPWPKCHACAQKTVAKSYNNKKSQSGRSSDYVDETKGFEKKRYTSAAESTYRGAGVPTIIIYKETITFNNNNNYNNNPGFCPTDPQRAQG